jgi:uncharacterized protein YjbI with pentapeptide repeats
MTAELKSGKYQSFDANLAESNFTNVNLSNAVFEKKSADFFLAQ